MPNCIPDANDCPGGLVCQPFSPMLSGSGACLPPCQNDADCGGFTCVQGMCKCTSTQQCQIHSGGSCDTISGTCYSDCSNCSGIACCSQAHGLAFCDYFTVYPDPNLPPPPACL